MLWADCYKLVVFIFCPRSRARNDVLNLVLVYSSIEKDDCVVVGRYVMDKDKHKSKELRQVRKIGVILKAELG